MIESRLVFVTLLQQADLEAALRQLAANNDKLDEVISHQRMGQTLDDGMNFDEKIAALLSTSGDTDHNDEVNSCRHFQF